MADPVSTSTLVVQVVGIICTCVVTVMTTLYGFKRATETFEKKLEEKLVTKIDRDTYTAKVKELHDVQNAANIKIAEQGIEIGHLKEKLAELRGV